MFTVFRIYLLYENTTGSLPQRLFWQQTQEPSNKSDALWDNGRAKNEKSALES